MRETTARVEKLLIANPELRDSDKKLLFAYWEQEGLWFSERQKHDLMNATPPESISRARRRLRDKYPARPEIEAERFDKFKQTQAEYSQLKAWF